MTECALDFQKVCISLKINYHALYDFGGYVIFVLLIFHKVLKQNMNLILKIDYSIYYSDAHNSFSQTQTTIRTNDTIR